MSTPSQHPLSPLALRVLADHQRAPRAEFYDLFSLGSLVNLNRMGDLDAAYKDLTAKGLVEQVPGGAVTIAGQFRGTYRLRANGSSRAGAA
jgi:hypothetical protein